MFKRLFLSLLLVGTLLQATAPSRISVAKLYIATFDRAPDAEGLEYWLYSGLDIESIAMSFFDQKETKAKYPSGYSHKKFINDVYQNLFGRDVDPEGLNYWVESIQNNKISRSLFILAVINGALGDDADILTNKLLVGLAFADAKRDNIAEAREIMRGITKDIDSVKRTLSKYKLNKHILTMSDQTRVPISSSTASGGTNSNGDTTGSTHKVDDGTTGDTTHEVNDGTTGDTTHEDDDETTGDTTTSAEPTQRDIPEYISNLAIECTFGPTIELVDEIYKMDIIKWLDEQFDMPSAYDSVGDTHLSYIERTIDIAKQILPQEFPYTISEYLDPNNDIVFNITASRAVSNIFDNVWFENAIEAKDQLRQRVAYALSQILVVSDSDSTFSNRADGLASYYDILAKHAFGNYRDLLIEVSMSPSMGIYLTHQGSKKYDPKRHNQPDENYARELMQLFTIGLHELNLNGIPKTDQYGDTIPTYTQSDIEEFARVFTGWDLAKNDRYGHAASTQGSYTEPMEFTPSYHDFGEKHVLGRVIAANNSGVDDIKSAIDILMQHPNIAPFVSRKLIQRLVTSNPTPSYIERVAKVFNDNGAGVKGDLKAVIRAILLDREAVVPSSTFKKVKEPIVAYVQFLRAFDVHYLPIAWNPESMGGDKNVMVKDIYKFNRTYPLSLKNLLGQAPMRSESVFNFYSPDYIPSDIYFQRTKFVSPELQIMSEEVMINFSNRLAKDLDTYEKLEAEVRGNYDKFYDKYMLSLEREFDIVKGALDGDLNNIDNREYKERAVKALIEYLDHKLTWYGLSTLQKSTIESYLNSTSYSADIRGIKSMIIQAATAILTTNTYLMQR